MIGGGGLHDGEKASLDALDGILLTVEVNENAPGSILDISGTEGKSCSPAKRKTVGWTEGEELKLTVISPNEREVRKIFRHMRNLENHIRAFNRDVYEYASSHVLVL